MYSMARASSAELADSGGSRALGQLVEVQPLAGRGEVSNCASGGKARGGAHNRADRESVGITYKQVANLREASLMAERIGLPLNRFITIDWELGGIPLAGMAKATGRITNLLTEWLRRQGYRTAWIRVHENAGSVGGHCHMLVHVPPTCVAKLVAAQKRWLRSITGGPYLRRAIKSVPIGGLLGLETSNHARYRANLERTVAYLCKGALQPSAAGWRQPGGRVIGKRCGTSQNIGAKARSMQ